MKQKLGRNEAKEIIAIHELKSLTDKSKIQILEENYWWFDEKDSIIESIEDGKYPKISEDFIELINKTPNPTLVEEAIILLIDYEKQNLRYSTNLYLQSRLNVINHDFGNYVIEEEEEIAGLCPCCEYYSIDFGEDGLWDICPVCFWENGGESPNHMTLEEGRANFKKFGVINESFLKYTDQEGKRKYRKKV